MRLIDADALEAKLDEQRKLYIEMDMKGAEHLLVHDVLHHVWEAPAIDAVQVVRCKDCKHSIDYYNDGECYCRHLRYNGETLLYIEDGYEHYCSFGERKDNEID